MKGSIFQTFPKIFNFGQNLGQLVHEWIHFQIPSGTPLPKPNLSNPPPPAGIILTPYSFDILHAVKT